MAKAVLKMNPARWTALAVLGLSAALLLAPPPAGVDARILRGAAMVVFAMGLFATAALPEFVTGLAFYAIATLIAVAPTAVIFAGWTSAALWLIIGGLVIGIAVERTGLGARMAEHLTGLFGARYANQAAAVVIASVALAFLMPSTMGRVIILVPITLAVADRLGFEPGRNGRAGLIVAMAFSTWMPGTGILPANLPNMVLAGVSESLYGIHITYGEYLLVHFPVIVALKALSIYGLVLALFPDEVDAAAAEPRAHAPMGRDEKLLAVILSATLALWILDFLHGISPAWIALAAATLCLLPGVDLVPPKEFNAKFNTASVIYVASILSVAAVFVDTGLGTFLGRKVVDLMPLAPGDSATNFGALVMLSSATSLAATAPGVAAILSPVAQEMARAADLPLMSVLMSMVVGYSTVFLPYQVPPIVVALQLGGVPIGKAARYTLVLAALTILVLLPADYLWWLFLGYLG